MRPGAPFAAAAAALLVLGACQDVPFTPDPQPETRIPLGAPSGELRTGWIYGPDGEPMEVTFTVFEGWAIFEGDINLGRADEIAATREALTRSGGPRFGVFINGSSYRWPSGTVPYVIDASFTWSQQQTILSAMNHVVGNVGGVRFKQRTNETAYIVFAAHSSVCNSFVGRQGNTQTVNLTSGCANSMGIVAHEILHALGMWHEQSRCDRDSFVTVNLNNVLTANRHNFDKKCSGNTSVFAYNEGSLMHYGTHDFSFNGGQVITSKRGLDWMMGQRSGLAQTDASTINWIYTPYVLQNLSITNSGGNALISWSPSGGATHYTMKEIVVYEYFNNWTGEYRSSESWWGGGNTTGTSMNGGPYTGESTCIIYDSMYETEQVTHMFEMRAHFPDGINGAIGRWHAPIAQC